MEYEIVISDTCLEEMEENCYYIEKVLKAEQASNRLMKKIMETIQGLKNSPKIYAKIEKTDRAERDYRIVIFNYIIIYTIIEEDKTILISHMYYGGRNYLDGGLL